MTIDLLPREVAVPVNDLEDSADAPGSTRSLVRLLAMAATVLLISFLVVNRSTDALIGRGGAEGRFAAGHVALADDDTDRSLFDVPAMAPGDEHENCLSVTYSGVVEDPVVRLAGRATGPLAESLRFSVAVGQGGGFGDCAGFVPEATLYEGSLAGFTDAHPPRNGLTAFTPVGRGDERTFRFVFELVGATAEPGAEAAVEFDWNVTSGG